MTPGFNNSQTKVTSKTEAKKSATQTRRRAPKLSVESARTGSLQRKLAIGSANDPLEREADEVARMVTAPAKHGQLPPTIQRSSAQTGGDAGSAPESVERVLSRTGQPLGSQVHRDMGERFGHDFAQVRVHTDADAAASADDINAKAYTVGNNVVFGSGQFNPGTDEGRFLIAHELTHVVQQSAVSNHDGKVSDSHNKIMRFEFWEHKSLGDSASDGMSFNFIKNGDKRFELKYGDIVALSGDHFKVDELMMLAKIEGDNGQKVGSIDEIIYAIKWKHKGDSRFEANAQWSNFTFSDDVKHAVENRYANLAAKNYDHFLNPDSTLENRSKDARPTNKSPGSAASYRMSHSQAIKYAYEYGALAEGEAKSYAMALEAAAQHYLSDSFAAGHVRTPRESIQAYWGKLYPLFWYNMRQKISLDVAAAMDKDDIPGWITSVQFLYTTVLKVVSEKTQQKPDFNFGDLLSKVFHDKDNESGLKVVGGKIYGDDNLYSHDKGHPENITAIVAEKAMRAGIQDIDEALLLSKDQPGLKDLDAIIKKNSASPNDKFKAENLIPVLSDDNPAQNWYAPDFETLWGQKAFSGADLTVGALIKESFKNGEVNKLLYELAEELDETEYLLFHPKRAYIKGFLDPIAIDAENGIRSIINWAPSSNPALANEDRDDVALATGQELSKDKKLAGMTTPARVDYIKELSGGYVAEDEEKLIVQLFETAAPSERAKIYSLVEGHEWQGDWVEGVFKRDDNIWNALSREKLMRVRDLINEAR